MLNARAVGFSIFLFAVANLIVYTDALDFALRLYMRRRHTAAAGGISESSQFGNVSINLAAILPPDARRVVPASPFAIIASVYNLEDHIEEFTQNFGAYRDRVWLISDGSTDNTVLRLRQAGWRCFDDGVNRRKPGAIRRLLERMPAHIETVMVIDPDVRIRGLNEGSTHRYRAVRQRLPAIRRRGGLPAHHDRAGRIPGPLPVVRICAGVSHRPREPGRLQYHLGRCLVLPARRAGRAR